MLTVIAGVGVLLLAMGVGVLIGRSGSSKQSAPPAQVISVASTPGTGTAAAAAEATFTSDWQSSSKGYTIQLQTLPLAGTSVTAVTAAKTAASAKGAHDVGALKSEDFASLSGSTYVIYSGVYHARAQAQRALHALKKDFPTARVIEVSNGGSSAGAAVSGSAGKPPSSLTHPAPASTLNKLKSAKGKSYEEKSKNLPDVVETG